LLSQQQLEAFCKRAILFARDQVPRAHDMSDDEMRASLDRTMTHAEEFEVRTEHGIVMLFCAVLLRWENIFALPEVRRALGGAQVSERERIEAAIGVL
jgi:hypothetical protein